MAKPRLIIVIRHAQSEGNKNREIHQQIPDHRVKLTPLGWQQARDAGRRLRAMLRPEDSLQFYTSPYRRTRETTDGILESLTGADPGPDGAPSPFARENIKVYEEPRLREQDFGNFQPCSAEMERMWQERADYGHFFYRIPNGESAADAYDRVSGFNESLWRQFGDPGFPTVCVLVTHGLMSRVFLMKWYHFTVEYFEDLRNINHCELLIMRKHDDTDKYLLDTKLRTWSELRKERAEKDKDKEMPKLERTKTFVSTRRWGGCPNGCNHTSHYKRREDLEVLRQSDSKTAAAANALGGGSSHPSPAVGMMGASSFTTGSPNLSVVSSNGDTIASRRLQRQQTQTSYNTSDDDASPGGLGGADGADGGGGGGSVAAAPAVAVTITTKIDVAASLDEMVSSPDGTPSFISPECRAFKSPQFHHLGRDGGGSYSGVQSLANSDAEELSEDDLEARRRIVAMARARRNGGAGNAALSNVTTATTGAAKTLINMQSLAAALESTDGMRHGAKANRLGDGSGSDASSSGDAGDAGDAEPDPDDDDPAKAEEKDRSIMGSVY